jgi:hypothetical protein
MKLTGIVMIVILICAVLAFIRGGQNFPIAHILPFSGGKTPGFYDLASIIVIAIVCSGIYRLLHPKSDDDGNDE